MKRFLRIAFMVAMVSIWPARSYAIQFILPYVTQQSTTSSSTNLILSTTGFVSNTYMHCLQHVTVQSNVANTQFIITTDTVTSSNTLSLDTTGYVVTLSSGTPYDTQWPPPGGWCGPPNNQVNLKVINGGTFTISVEEFTTKGWNP